MPQRIADRLPQVQGGRYSPNMVLEPDMQGLHDRPTSLLPCLPSIVGRMAADLSLDLVELANAFQHLARQRRLGRGVEIMEIPPQMNQGAFLMRGLEKVRAEFSLTALAYNLRRVLIIVWVTKMLCAAAGLTAPAFAG